LTAGQSADGVDSRRTSAAVNTSDAGNAAQAGQIGQAGNASHNDRVDEEEPLDEEEEEERLLEQGRRARMLRRMRIHSGRRCKKESSNKQIEVWSLHKVESTYRKKTTDISLSSSLLQRQLLLCPPLGRRPKDRKESQVPAATEMAAMVTIPIEEEEAPSKAAVTTAAAPAEVTTSKTALVTVHVEATNQHEDDDTVGQRSPGLAETSL